MGSRPAVPGWCSVGVGMAGESKGQRLGRWVETAEGSFLPSWRQAAAAAAGEGGPVPGPRLTASDPAGFSADSSNAGATSRSSGCADTAATHNSSAQSAPRRALRMLVKFVSDPDNTQGAEGDRLDGRRHAAPQRSGRAGWGDAGSCLLPSMTAGLHSILPLTDAVWLAGVSRS